METPCFVGLACETRGLSFPDCSHCTQFWWVASGCCAGSCAALAKSSSLTGRSFSNGTRGESCIQAVTRSMPCCGARSVSHARIASSVSGAATDRRLPCGVSSRIRFADSFVTRSQSPRRFQVALSLRDRQREAVDTRVEITLGRSLAGVFDGAVLFIERMSEARVTLSAGWPCWLL